MSFVYDPRLSHNGPVWRNAIHQSSQWPTFTWTPFPLLCDALTQKCVKPTIDFEIAIRGRRCVFRKAESLPLKRTIMSSTTIWQVHPALCFCKILTRVRGEAECIRKKALGNRHSELKVSVDLFQIQHAYQQSNRLVEACKCLSLQYKKNHTYMRIISQMKNQLICCTFLLAF